MLIDYFPFFNEKELLELRINLLKDHVDQFVIVEANKSFTGRPRDFIVKKTIKELGLPESKIRVIELVYPEDINDIPLEVHDLLSMFPEDKSDVVSIVDLARERMQRNGIMSILDDYQDDDWFIMSDCDEMLNPNHLNFAFNVAKNTPNSFVKLPLINLYGEADLRPFYSGNVPFTWRDAMTLCKKSLLKQTTPHRIRCGYHLPYGCVYPTLSGKIFDEFGWHFSWMGDIARRKLKSDSYAHANNVGHKANFKNGFDIFKEGNSLPWSPGSVLKKFPHSELPKLIFELPRVREFMLPGYQKEM